MGSSQQVATSSATPVAHLHLHDAPEAWRQPSHPVPAAMDSNRQVPTSPAKPCAHLHSHSSCGWPLVYGQDERTLERDSLGIG